MRGDIYRLRAPRDARGHEQHGKRYAILVQSDDLLLSTVLAIPTSTSARPARFRPEIDIDGTTARALVEHMAAVDPQTRLGEWVGRLSPAEQQSVDTALLAVLALD